MLQLAMFTPLVGCNLCMARAVVTVAGKGEITRAERMNGALVSCISGMRMALTCSEGATRW